MRDIASILGLKGQQARLDTLHRELVALGTKWRDIIVSAPVDFPIAKVSLAPSKRIRWLENNIRKPADRLLSSISEENAPYFSPWGVIHHDASELEFSREPIRHELNELLESIDDLIAGMKALHKEEGTQTGDMRYEIVWDMVQLFKLNCPELAVNRGTYDSKTKRWIGHFPEFVDAAFAEITGGDTLPGKKLDNLLKLALKD